jgi:hypothetical protein
LVSHFQRRKFEGIILSKPEHVEDYYNTSEETCTSRHSEFVAAFKLAFSWCEKY